MSREIKFRAWTGSVFRSWEDIKKVTGFHHWLFGEEKRVVLMQYTGLKDKNGKEIYEGDILYGTNPNGMHNCVWECVSLENFHHYQETEEAINEYGNIEVIGNIYENPELLK